MKGRIMKDGELIITAEDDTEAFAISLWYENYKTGNKKSTLSIEQVVVEKGEEKIINLAIKEGKK